MLSPSRSVIAGIAAFTGSAYLLLRRRRKLRAAALTAAGIGQRVVIIGASSGVGKDLALLYAARGARLCLVARRELSAVVQECEERGATDCSASCKDASKAEDVFALQAEVQERWDGVDLLVICAGALTVQPVLAVTGQVSAQAPTQVSSPSASVSSLRSLASLATQSYAANVLPALLLSSAFVSLLLPGTSHRHEPRRDSRICVISSVAAEIPAPTRAMYAANKAAVSMLMRSLRIELEKLFLSSEDEQRRIGVTLVHPASIATGLRAAALDSSISNGDTPMEPAAQDSKERKAMTALSVAQAVVDALDRGTDEVWLPGSYWWIAKLVMPLLPGIVARGAKKKYGFE